MNLRKLFWFIRTKVLWFRFGYLGKRSYLGRPLYISSTKRLFIGDSVRIYPGMRAELIVAKLPYALETVGEYTNVGFVKPTDSSMLKEQMCFLMKYGSFKNEKNWENDVKFEQFNDWNELFNNIIKDGKNV